MSSTTTVVAFVGLGAMGGAIARRLATGPFTVQVFDRAPAAVDRAVQAGAVAAPSAHAALKGAAVVMSSLPTPEIVEAFWSENGAHLDADAVAMDLSTIDPITARRISDSLTENQFVACTVGRTPAHAETGEIPAFIGGPAPAIERVQPVLDRIANSVHDMGSVEGATMFKLISNHIGMSNLVLIAEGYALARRAGIQPDVFTQALRTTGAWSTQADIRLPWIVDGDYTTRFSVDLAAKDLRLATDAAARWHVPTPVAAAALSAFSAASAAGHGTDDAAAVIEAIDPRRTARDTPTD